MQIKYNREIVARAGSAKAFLEAQDVTIDREFRWELALETCRWITERGGHAEPIDYRCPCGNFLLFFPALNIERCWCCYHDQECARIGRLILDRLCSTWPGYQAGRDHTYFSESAPL